MESSTAKLRGYTVYPEAAAQLQQEVDEMRSVISGEVRDVAEVEEEAFSDSNIGRKQQCGAATTASAFPFAWRHYHASAWSTSRTDTVKAEPNQISNT